MMIAVSYTHLDVYKRQGQCISACGTVNRNNPDGQLLRWVANDDARRNEARFSALSKIDEDAGG